MWVEEKTDYHTNRDTLYVFLCVQVTVSLSYTYVTTAIHIHMAVHTEALVGLYTHIMRIQLCGVGMQVSICLAHY